MKRILTLLALGLIIVVGSAGSASATLIVHFAFEGNVLDSSGNALHGTIPEGTPTYVASTDRAFLRAPGYFGQAISFDGTAATGAFVSVAHNPLFDFTTGLTLMAWMNVTHTGGDAPGWWDMDLIQRVGVFKLEEHQATGNYAFVAEASPWHTSPWGAFPLIEGTGWRHFAGTWDSATGTVKTYVDGVLVGTGTGATGGLLPINTNPLLIGCPGFWGIPGTIALIDEVRVYSRALSVDEIVAVSAIPEPATMILLGLGLSFLGLKGLKRKKA